MGGTPQSDTDDEGGAPQDPHGI